MKVFLKYVLKSMTEKKGRFFLLILAISISTALLVASTGMIDMIMNSIVAPQLEALENKDIVIISEDESSQFFSDEGIQISGIKEDSILKELYIDGMVADKINTDDETMLYISIRGRDMKYIKSNSISQGNLNNLKGETCIISERVAKHRNLKLNDQIDLILAGVTKSFKIIAISAESGVFYNDSVSSFSVLVPYEYLSNDLGVEGKYNVIFANSSEKTVKAGVEKFNESNDLFNSDQLFDKEATKKQLSGFTSMLYIMLIVVAFMSAIIIYSTFKLIITERLSTIGTFLSQGATVGKVKFILYIESFTYGILGAIFGNGLGILGLFVINRLISPLKDYGIYGKVTIEPMYIIIGTLFAVILSMISAYLPVRKISKLQVKDIILNDVRISKSIGWKKFIIGCILIVGSVLSYVIAKDKLSGFAGIILIISLTGVIFVFPKMVDILSRLLYKMLRGRSKSVIYAINNLRTSKILLGNISLIIISLTSIITIISLGSTMIDVVTEAYTKLDYDIEINNISTIRENGEESTADYLVKELKKIGIKEDDINLVSYLNADISNSDVKSKTTITAMGMDPDTYIPYNEYLQLDKPEYSEYINDFRNNDSGIIITTVLGKMLNKKVGETVELTCNGLVKQLTITGIIDAKLYNNGYIVLLKNTTMEKLFAVASVNSLTFITDKDPDSVLKELKPVLRQIGATAMTRDEMCKQNVKQNEMIVKALSIFAYMAIVIAALGIVNNISISFLQRKTEFAVLASVGMDNSGRTKILFFESIASVTWAIIITSVFCVFSLKLVSVLTKSIGFDMVITLDYKSLPMIYLFSMAIVLIATIPVYFKSRKLSIIQELKYE